MLIETIAIFGQKPKTRALAMALAEQRQYLVDIYAPKPDDVHFYTRLARTKKLPSLGFLFSRTVENAAWGADAIIIDSASHIALLPEIARAANDTGIVIYAGTLSDQHAKALRDSLKTTSLVHAEGARLKRLWPACQPLPA